MNHTITIEEGQRQLILKALASLAVACPGWDHALNEIALKMDNEYELREENDLVREAYDVDKYKRAQMYDEFKRLTLVGLGDHVEALHNLQAIMRGGIW